MKIIVPFCRMSPNDFLYDPKASVFIEKLFSELGRLNFDAEVTIFADDYFSKMFQDLRLNDFRLCKVAFGDQGFRSAGPEAVIANPVFLNVSSPDSDLVILSPRNPALPADRLGAAIETYKKKRTGMLASVVASSDHPCQLFSLTESQHGNVYFSETEDTFFEKPFADNPELWVLGEDYCPAINQISGKPILGRQDFPPVFETDGSFIMVHSSILRNACQSSILPDVYGFVIDGDQSIHIYTRLDYLKYKAAIRAGKQSGNWAADK
tara:strand:- start:542 stop:1339 length:798 start_codon:yes stop_codon:yes gene_type:complete